MENKEYLNKRYKYCQVSKEFHPMLSKWIETEKAKVNLYNGGISQEERKNIENWINTKGEPYLITGIYHWGRIFGDDYSRTWLFHEDVDDYEEFDIVHVNFFGLTESLITDIRKRIGWNSKTKIVVNIDYSVEIFGRCEDFKKPYQVARDLESADMIFATEPRQLEALQVLLSDDKKIHLIPHPTAVNELKGLYMPVDERLRKNKHPKPVILVNLHRWDFNYLLPFFALKPRDDKRLDYENYVSNINEHDLQELNKARLLYRHHLVPMPFSRFMEFSRMFYVALDSYTLYSYGRFCLDFACLGIPVVGSETCDSQKRIFPELTTHQFDVKKQYEILKELRYNREFHQEVINKGMEEVEFYNYENSRGRFLEALFRDK